MKEAIPMDSPDQSRYSEPDRGCYGKDVERLLSRQADPYGKSKRHEPKTPERSTQCVNTRGEPTPLRCIETMLRLSLLLVAFDQTDAGWKDGGECQKQTPETRAVAFCDNTSKDGAYSTKQKSQGVFARLRLI
jgi:hypothetical protein